MCPIIWDKDEDEDEDEDEDKDKDKDVYCREEMAAAGGEIGKVVNVNVGGILYTTTLATITKVRLVKFYRVVNVEYVYPSSQRLAHTTIEQFSAQPLCHPHNDSTPIENEYLCNNYPI